MDTDRETLSKGESGLFSVFFNLAEYPVFLLERGSGRITDINSQAVSFLGHPRPNLLGMLFADFLAAADRHLISALCMRDSKTSQPVRASLVCDQGREVDVLIEAAPCVVADMPFTVVVARDAAKSQGGTADSRDALEELGRSEARYRAIVEDQTELIVRFRPDGEITFVNGAYSRCAGKSQAELIGQDFMSLLPDDEREEMMLLVRSASLTEENPTIVHENRLVLHTGEVRWVRCTTRAIYDREGRQVEFQCVGHDITELKRMHEKLRRSESLLRKALTATANGVWDYNPISGDINVDPAFEMLLGYAPHEIGASCDAWGDLLHPEDRGKAASAMADHLSGQLDHFEGEFRLRCKGGGWRWIRTRGGVVEWDKNLNPSRVVGIHSDISDHKEVEQAAKEREERYRAFIHGFQGIAYYGDTDYTGGFFHGAVELITGYTEDQFVAGRPKWEEIVHPDDMAVFRGSRDKDRDADSLSGEREYRIIRSDGQTRWVRELVQRIQNKTGKSAAIQGAIYDISDQKRAEEAMRRASRMEASATLAGGIAHQFNNLMTVILGNADLMREGLRDDEPFAKMLDEIGRSAQRAGSLAQHMLAFARGGKYQPELLNLNDVIQEVLRLEAETIPKGISVVSNLEPALWTVEADRTQMNLVLVNLCSNAVETITGEGRVTIATRNMYLDEGDVEKASELKEGRHVCITVSDTGRGMSPDVAARVFEPFFTTKFHGRGLGLAAVYGIVRNHGGHVFVDSEVDVGTTFTIYLPATRSMLGIAKGKPRHPGRGKATVLVVDDEKMVLRVTEKLLTHLGYNVLLATNGLEAVELARKYEGTIEVALLDMVMPEMTGAQAFPLLKEARPDLRVIIFSGHELDASAQALLDAGADIFLQKPVGGRDLAQVIETVIQAHHT